jgi:hypothetical protein
MSEFKPQTRNDSDFLAAEQPAIGFFSEVWDFLRQNKRWWLMPVVGILLLFGVLMFLSGTAAAPFIYTLF